MSRLKICFLLGVALVLSGARALAVEQTHRRAIVLSWDGTHAGEIRRLLAQGKLTNLAKLIAGGAFTDRAISVFPSQTAPGHAALWTGAEPAVSQISGNQVPRTPRSQATLVESVSGFSSHSLAAEPLWISAARSGYRTVVVQATQAWPFDTYTAGPANRELSERLVFFEGYAGGSGHDGVVTSRRSKPQPASGWKDLPPSLAPPREITFTVGNALLYGVFIDDPADPADGYDTLLIAQVRDGQRLDAALKPAASEAGNLAHWSSTVELPGMNGGALRFRLFDLQRDASNYLLYFTRPAREQSTRPDLLPELRQIAGAFVGNGASHLYLQGALGQPLFRGGNGTAERRYLETVYLNQQQLWAATRWAMQRLPWDLLLTYTPYPDEAEHLWRGFLEPELRGFRPELADRLRPFLEEVYRSADAFLGMLMQLRSEETVIAVVSDHGVEGVNQAVRVNAVLQHAGLLVADSKGQVDLSKTKALYPTNDSAYVLINTTDRKQGIVPVERRGEVVEQVRAVLSQVRQFGTQVVTACFDALSDGAKMGVGGAAGGDVYLDLAPGYDFDPHIGKGDWIVAREPYGTHGFNPLRVSMRTIMVFNGPGVAAGRRLGEARNIDFAPTLAHLLGIAAPRDASGRVLTEVLRRQD